MNPFEQAPATPPVSLDPPQRLVQSAPRRGRMAIAALAASGLMGVGLVGVSQFAAADRPELDPNENELLASPTPDDDDSGEPEPTDRDEDRDDRDDDGNGDDHDGDGPIVDGQIVIDTGTGEPIVIDLHGGTVDGQSFEQVAECLGLPALGEGKLFDLETGEFPLEDLEGMLEDVPFGEFPIGEFGDFEHFGEFGPDGTHVTVLGPDGLSVIELGDGDGSVTITQEDGAVEIETDGSATVKEIDDMLGAIELPDPGSSDFEQKLEDFRLDRFEQLLPDDFEGFDFELPTDLQACLDASGTD